MNIKQEKSDDIEFLFAQGKGTLKQPPIVLVHGAYNNATVWTNNLFPYFTALGHDVYAIQLKNNKEAYSKRTLIAYTLKAYTNKLNKLIQHIDSQYILIGHSMGGLIAQKYISTFHHKPLATCLLAAVPPYGTINTIKMMMGNPVQLLRYTALTLNPAIAQKYPPSHGLLSERSDEATRKSFQSFIIRESAVALFQTFYPKLNIDVIRKTPILVTGAANDNLILPKDIVKTGQLYNQEAKIYPHMGHFMMLEPDWEQKADDCYTWIQNQL